MGTSIVEKNFIKIDNLKLWRTNASIMQLGHFGKKTITAPPYLDPARIIALPANIPLAVTLISLDIHQTKKGDFTFGINQAQTFGASVATAFDKVVSGQLSLIWIKIADRSKLLAAINSDQTLLDEWKRRLNKGEQVRAVDGIVQVVSGTLATTLSQSIHVTGTFTQNGINVTASVGVGGSNTVSQTFSPGSTFGYALAAANGWSPSITNKRTINSLRTDIVGPS